MRIRSYGEGSLGTYLDCGTDSLRPEWKVRNERSRGVWRVSYFSHWKHPNGEARMRFGRLVSDLDGGA